MKKLLLQCVRFVGGVAFDLALVFAWAGLLYFWITASTYTASIFRDHSILAGGDPLAPEPCWVAACALMGVAIAILANMTLVAIRRPCEYFAKKWEAARDA